MYFFFYFSLGMKNDLYECEVLSKLLNYIFCYKINLPSALKMYFKSNADYS